MPDHPTLQTASGAGAILEALARFLAWEAHPDKDCPDSAIPSKEDAREWGKAPADIEAAHGEWRELPEPRPAHPLMPFVTVWQAAPKADRTPAAVLDAATNNIAVRRTISQLAAVPEPETNLAGAPIWPELAQRTLTALIVQSELEERRTRTIPHPYWDNMRGVAAPHAPGLAICERLAQLPADPDAIDSPSLLTLAIESIPVDIEPQRRKDKRILPTVSARAYESRPERQRGELFGGQLEGRIEGSPELPLFESPPVRKSVSILDIADSAGVPVMARGRGTPLSARLFVRAGLAVDPADRHLQSVRITVTVKELRNALYPPSKTTGWTGWRPARNWPELKAALKGARDYTIRLPDGGRWFMLALRRLPAEDAKGLPDLDDFVVLDLAMPPGATSGPPIDLPTLDRLSVKSAPRWRAYIAAHALTWEPGKTRRPMPNHGGRYGWSRDAADYPILTLKDRRRLAFGEQDSKNRTQTEIDAPWQDLPGIVSTKRTVDPKTGEVGWRIMPAEVAPDDD